MHARNLPFGGNFAYQGILYTNYVLSSEKKANTTLDPKNIWSSEKYTELLKIYGALKNIQIPPPASTTHYLFRTSGCGGRGNGLCMPAAESVYFSELRIFFRASYIFQSSIYFWDPEWNSHLVSIDNIIFFSDSNKENRVSTPITSIDTRNTRFQIHL